MMWNIETAREKDIQPIVRDIGGGMDVDRRAVLESKIARYVRKPGRTLFIAKSESRAVGFGAVIEKPDIKGDLPPDTVKFLDGFSMITGLLVDAEYRNRGIGQALVRSMEGWAFERPATGIWLVTRLQAEWYRRHFGYEAMGTIISENIRKTILAKKPGAPKP